MTYTVLTAAAAVTIVEVCNRRGERAVVRVRAARGERLEVLLESGLKVLNEHMDRRAEPRHAYGTITAAVVEGDGVALGVDA